MAYSGDSFRSWHHPNDASRTITHYSSLVASPSHLAAHPLRRSANSTTLTASPGGGGSSDAPSSDAITRYERVIEVLTQQALSQQKEIAELKSALMEIMASPPVAPADHEKKTHEAATEKEKEAELKVKDRKRLSRRWCRRVEAYTVTLLEAHLREMDERLAQGLVERLRRVTREHVRRSIDKEVRRLLTEWTAEGKAVTTPSCTKPTEQHETQEQTIPTRLTTTPPLLLKRDTYEASGVVENNNDKKKKSIHAKNLHHPSIHFSNTRNSDDRNRDARRSASSKRSAIPRERLAASFAYVPSNDSPHSLDALPQRVAVLEQRLAAATSPIVFTDHIVPKQLPSLEERRGDGADGRQWSSSCALTSSTSTSNVSSDIDLLLDVFEGRQSMHVVRRLLE